MTDVRMTEQCILNLLLNMDVKKLLAKTISQMPS